MGHLTHQHALKCVIRFFVTALRRVMAAIICLTILAVASCFTTLWRFIKPLAQIAWLICVVVKDLGVVLGRMIWQSASIYTQWMRRRIQNRAEDQHELPGNDRRVRTIRETIPTNRRATMSAQATLMSFATEEVLSGGCFVHSVVCDER